MTQNTQVCNMREVAVAIFAATLVNSYERRGEYMKCLTCKCEFEMTNEESKKHEYLAYFSEKCAMDAVKCIGTNKQRKDKCPPFHVGPKGCAPKFGTFEQVEIEDVDGNKRVVILNVGGRITVRPMTQEERDHIDFMRGRETFSESCTVCILPSAHFYRDRHRVS